MSQKALSDTRFDALPLHDALQQALGDIGFSHCTPIQALTLPKALAGQDIAGQAQTGTGKTAAFLLATIHRLLSQAPKEGRPAEAPRALIVAPTRELAIQIAKDAEALLKHTDLKLALIYGGIDYDKQRQQLADGCDIIVATPGRLIDYFKQKVFTLKYVDVLVLDEADRMFDLGFIADIRYLMRRLPPREQRQSLLFSATLSHRVTDLAYEHMNDPERMTVEADSITADRVTQIVHFPASEEKLTLLLNLLQREQPDRCIIFINTKATAEKISRTLERYGHKVALMSGDVRQKKRQSLLKRFQAGEIHLMVATDVAARGLHIDGVTHVFNYDLPQDPEDYVHRIGRTARAGAKGDAISFACDRYAMSLPAIEAYIEDRIPVAGYDPDLLKPLPKPPKPPKQENGEQESREQRNDRPPRRRRRRRKPSGKTQNQPNKPQPNE